MEVMANGLLARVLQHEIDHLKGKLIIDYIDTLEKPFCLDDRIYKKQ